MNPSHFEWKDYYTHITGRQPRDLLVEVLKRFETTPTPHTPTAIDLGCGDGTETAFLLANGWQVLAIDSEPQAFTYLEAKIPPSARDRLQTQIASFEAVALSPVDLIYAGFSVPFCHPQAFPALWQKIVSNLNPGGRFAGQLFGVRDTWASHTDMTFFTVEQARALVSGLEIEYFQEEEEDGRSTIGPKHWHLFHIIARKPYHEEPAIHPMKLP
jgi:tellurite methyltransferase